MRSVCFVLISTLFVCSLWGQAYTQPQQTPPIRVQPLQTPPKSITHNGVMVYNQNTSNPTQPQTGTPGRTMPPGYGSPYPTGTNPTQVAQTQNVWAQAQPQYAPPQYAQPQPPIVSPPMRVASVPTSMPAQAPQQLQHVGRAAPPNGMQNVMDMRLSPFVLQPQEQQELDAFLARWEKISDTVDQYHANLVGRGLVYKAED